MQQDPISIFPEKSISYAGFWERFAAAFIDGLVLMVINFFISFLFGGSHLAGKAVGVTYNIGGSFAQIVAGWLYCALQESSFRQATFGKRAMGIKVTNMEGTRISFLQATGRHFGKYISLIILLIGYLMMLWDDKNQTLHDKMAGTLIVNDRKD
jgi:uncharacterized RDD family membrane protein YckC